jgi:hypothetical protein
MDNFHQYRVNVFKDAEEPLVLDALKLRTMISQVQRNQTLIVQLDRIAYLETLGFDFREDVSTWLQANQNTTTIFENGQVRTGFECVPSTSSCNSLLIRQLTKDKVGQYVKIGKSDDRTKYTFTSYTLAAFETISDGYCVQNSSCSYDSSKGVLSIKENENVTLSCSYYVWQSVDDNIENLPVEIDFPYEFGGACIFKPVTIVFDSIDPTTNAKRLLVSKQCSRQFDRYDSQFKCFLVNANDKKANDDIIISEVEVKIDMHFENQNTNDSNVSNVFQTVEKDETITLICPFDGKPIRYFWRNSSSNEEFEGDRMNIIEKHKTTGLLRYDCRAHIGGLINKWTSRVNFTIDVKEPIVIPQEKGQDQINLSSKTDKV